MLDAEHFALWFIPLEPHDDELCIHDLTWEQLGTMLAVVTGEHLN